MSRGTWTPPVDIYEVDGALVLKAELPEMGEDRRRVRERRAER